MLHRLWAQLRKAVMKARLGQRWAEGDDVARRSYPDYESYLAHQALKLDALRAASIEGHARRFEAALVERLARLPVDLRGASVLCLGAREGTEVRAFIARGAFAVGVDLNPGRDNRWVVKGDFHGLQYADGSVDVVYTNSMDHVLELERLVAEVIRVLKPNGSFVLEVGRGTEEGGGRGFYEALSWPRADRLIERVASARFERGESVPFDVPWIGLHTVLRKRR